MMDKHPALIVRTREPLNGGPPPARMGESFITPTELFFVRNHGDIPEIDPASYRLRVGGLVGAPLILSLDELRARFRAVTVTATIQCAGNRRSELMAIESISGEVPWGLEAVSTATWHGVRLQDVLAAAGPLDGARHVAFTGLDAVTRLGRTFGFGGSIPLDKALGPEVLLAFEMNGAPLPPIHGAPLRAVVPGYIGARSVKWLGEISVQAEPSDNYFQAQAYKRFPPDVRAETVDWSQGEMLGEIELTAAICAPEDGARLPAGETLVRGFALAGAGAALVRVELSCDSGATWVEAELLGAAEPWAWRLWRARLVVPPGETELVVRAWDTSGRAQPCELGEVWNFKGYMNNAWHRVRVTGV
jgi:sulfite oxidase